MTIQSQPPSSHALLKDGGPLKCTYIIRGEESYKGSNYTVPWACTSGSSSLSAAQCIKDYTSATHTVFSPSFTELVEQRRVYKNSLTLTWSDALC